MHPVKPLVFLHIPKTAGTTMHNILHNQYRGEKFFTSRNYKQIDAFYKLSDKEKLKITVIKGHFPFGVHEHYPAPLTYFTLLREPVARNISEFNYIYRKKNHPFHGAIAEKKLSLKETMRSGISRNFDNCQVRFLAGANELEFGKVNEDTYQLALDNFNKYFSAFGIMERFDESMIFLKRKLNWSNPYYVVANKTPGTGKIATMDDETTALMHQYTRYDRMLYDYAAKKFNEEVAHLGSGFQKEVERFTRLNNLQRPLRRLVHNLYRVFSRS